MTGLFLALVLGSVYAPTERVAYLKEMLQAVKGTEPRTLEIQYIAPVWMMLYGTGVYTAGLFSVRAPRVLGLVFIAAGVASISFFQQYGVITVALSFGLLHIIFGLYVIRKRRAGSST